MSQQPMTPHERVIYDNAVAHVRKTGDCSIAGLQAALRMSYNGAVEFIDRMQADGVISAPGEDGKREVLP